MNSDSPNTTDIVERLEGPVPVFNKNGQASIDLGENYRERKEAAAIIRRYETALRYISITSDDYSCMRKAARAALKDHRKAQAHD